MSKRTDPKKLLKQRNEAAREAGAKDDIKEDVKKYHHNEDNKVKREIDVDGARRVYLRALHLMDMEPHLKMIVKTQLVMGDESKKILLGMAMKYGVKYEVVLDMADEGKNRLKKYLVDHSIEDIVGKHDYDSTKFENPNSKIIISKSEPSE